MTGTRVVLALTTTGCGATRRRRAAEDLLRSRSRSFLFAAADVRNDVAEDVEGRDAGIACPRDRLHGRHHAPCERPNAAQRRENHRQDDGRAVRVGDDRARSSPRSRRWRAMSADDRR